MLFAQSVREWNGLFKGRNWTWAKLNSLLVSNSFCQARQQTKLSEANTNNLLILAQIVILKIIFYFPITENCRSQKKSVFNACFKKIVLQKSLQRTVFCFQFNSVFKGNVYLNNNLCFVFKPFRLVGSR